MGHRGEDVRRWNHAEGPQTWPAQSHTQEFQGELEIATQSSILLLSWQLYHVYISCRRRGPMETSPTSLTITRTPGAGAERGEKPRRGSIVTITETRGTRGTRSGAPGTADSATSHAGPGTLWGKTRQEKWKLFLFLVFSMTNMPWNSALASIARALLPIF